MKKFVALAAGVIVAASMTIPAFAEEGASMSVGASMKAKKTVDIACMQSAVDKREDAIIAAWSAFNTSMTSAHTMRKTALHDAWGMSDPAARRSAIKSAWENFRKSKKSAVQAWKAARKNAWKTFKSDAKKCKGVEAEAAVDASGEAADSE